MIMVALALGATACGVIAGTALPQPNFSPYNPADANTAFGNPMYLISEVSSGSGDGTDALCTASQEIARNAATVIAKQRVPHVTGIPAKSLRRLDACSLAFGHPQQDLVEIAEVFVYASGWTGAATCQLGTSIADAAWPKLPASS
jgi:hypothetical protein